MNNDVRGGKATEHIDGWHGASSGTQEPCYDRAVFEHGGRNAFIPQFHPARALYGSGHDSCPPALDRSARWLRR
jgi:hypothetical protein